MRSSPGGAASFGAEAARIVLDAGALLRTLDPHRVVSDAPGKGLLLEADLEVDRFVVAELGGRFPDHLVVTEERSGAVSPTGSMWILDPVCGTFNFARGIPYYAIGLSYWRDGEAQAAAIHNPASGELFTATRGGGAWLGDSRLSVSRTSRLGDAVICFNSNMSSPAGREQGRELFDRLCPPRTARLRLTESANLDLAFVAAGRYDGYVHPTDNIWDVAAGFLLVSEAGGRVSRYPAPEFTLTGEGVIASNDALFDSLRSAAVTPAASR